MIIVDFKCPVCGRAQEMRVKDVEAIVYCHNCESIMDRQLSAPYGRVVGYNYQNGYSNKRES